MPLAPAPGREPAKRTLEISKAMERAGVDSSILTTNECLPEYSSKLKGTDISVFICLFDGYYFPRARRKQLKQIIAPFDLVHITNHWTYLNALIYHACKQQQRPYVICPAGDMARTGTAGWLKKLFNALVGINQIRQAAGHVAISRNELPWFTEYGVKPEKITLIPNGINPAAFTAEPDSEFRKKLGPAETPFILFAGQLGRKWEPDLLLQSFLAADRESLSDFHLVFTGPDHGLEADLKKAAAASDHKDLIHFAGRLDREDMSRAYHAAELLVIPSRRLSMPAAALEAGACGTPVLLTEQCDFADLEEAGGCRVAPATTDGLPNELATMCRNRAGLKTMGQALKKYVLAHYTWDSLAQDYLKLYQQILG